MNENTKRFLKTQLVWMGVYFGIALVVWAFIPFPYSFIVLVGAILSLSMYRRRRFMRQGGGQSPFFGANPFGQQQKGISYYCINCGTKHNQAACPNCGSKMKKAGF